MTRTPLLIPAVLTTLVLTACGGASVANGTGSAHADAFLGLAKCIRANGVPSFPDPGGAHGGGIAITGGPPTGPGAMITVNGVSVSGPAFRHAMNACRNHFPNGGHPSAQQIAQLRASALTMARCMRAHGVPDFPDPKISSGPGGRIGIETALNVHGIGPSSPAFQAAQKLCMRGGFALPLSAGAKGAG